MEPVTTAALGAASAHLLASPRDAGVIELIVARPAPGERAVLAEAVLDPDAGLVGDCWLARGNRHTPDGSASPLMQLTLMNARVAALVAGPRDRWALAGDQLYVDLELGGDNLPPGTRLAVGTAVVEITEQPHTGCAKFAERFGMDVARFVSSPVGRAHNFRGINARVVEGGFVRPGDVAAKRG
ncbi:MAG: MOSC domain-containing protein [Acidimicrobiia bacterium]|jgi:hypothetical protein